MSRELDAEVAEKVMGHSIHPSERIADWITPRYSSEIKPAWEVHSRAMESFLFSQRKRYFQFLQDFVSTRVMTRYPEEKVAWPDVMRWLTPEDFCRAALEAVKK